MNAKLKTVLVVDSSINGVISRAEGSGEGSWNSPEDGVHYKSTITEIGVCIMGRTSFDVIGGKNYDGVKHYVMTNNPELLANNHGNENVIYTNKAYGELLDEIALGGSSKVAILGGSKVYTEMISHNLVDEIIITIEPVVLQAGVPLFGSEVNESNWQLVDHKKLNERGTLVLTYAKLSA
ncbi:MAG: dihydrofolate reductase family protein [bacterium]